MSNTGSLYEEEDDDQYSARTEDTLDQLLQSYTFKFEPEMRFKWNKRLSNFCLSAAYAKPWRGQWHWRIMLKPNGDPRWSKYVRKVLFIPNMSIVSISIPKLPIGPLRLQADLSYDLKAKRGGIDYRVTTHWSDGARVKSKVQWEPTAGAMLRAKHMLHWMPPAVSGHIGADVDEEDEQHGNMFGELDLRVTQLDWRFELP